MKLSRVIALTAGFAGILAVAASPAPAALIATGSNIDFNGGIDPIGGANVYNATGSDFRTNGLASVGTPGTIGVTNTAGGSFNVFTPATCPTAAAGGCGTIRDLLAYVQNSTTLTNPALPVLGFLSVIQNGATATFDLTTFSNTQLAPTQNQLGTLTLSGAGILHLTGFDATPGVLTITAQGDGNTSFSGTVVAVASVPEPASMALLGAGILGIGMLRRSRRQDGLHLVPIPG